MGRPSTKNATQVFHFSSKIYDTFSFMYHTQMANFVLILSPQPQPWQKSDIRLIGFLLSWSKKETNQMYVWFMSWWLRLIGEKQHSPVESRVFYNNKRHLIIQVNQYTHCFKSFGAKRSCYKNDNFHFTFKGNNMHCIILKPLYI